MIQISDKAIDIQAVITAANVPSAGGINVFIGTVRNKTAEKQVLRLEYEAYQSMAIAQMQQLVQQAQQRWVIEGIAIVHRVGVLDIGEVAVVLAVATRHRADAFLACQWLIDSLKTSVPIWKKEIFEDGEIWVSAHA